MENFKKSCATLGLSVCAVAFWYQNSQAYVDPSTGSYMYQLVIGSVFGVLFAVKVWWRNIRSLVGSKPSSEHRDRHDVEISD